MEDIVSRLYRVMNTFDDITVHQSGGRWPRIGDLVKVVEWSPDRNSAYAVSNGGNYGAFFLQTQLKELDDFLNIKGMQIERWQVVQM